MTWTSGTWAEVAIGDDVLGADGYAWSVTGAEMVTHDGNGDPASSRITMVRTEAPERTGHVLMSKSVKYRKAEPTTERGAWIQREAEETGESIEAVRAMVDDVDPAPVTQANGVKLASGTVAAPKVAPYVEYDDAERAAAAALKGAGLAMTVIERQMTLDGLTEHIGNVHGEPLPGAGGNLTRIELRSRLADLHFALHEHDQPRGQRWEPRGSTAHVHPVMDRPTGDPEPTSFRAKR